MNWELIWNWIVENYGLLIIIVVVVTIGLVKVIKKKKPKQEEFKPVPSPRLDSDRLDEQLNQINFDDDMMTTNAMEENNISHLRSQLRYIEEDIQAKLNAYKKGRQKYRELMEIDSRLRTFIPILQRQKKLMEEEIGRLER